MSQAAPSVSGDLHARFRFLVHQRTGIKLSDSRTGMVEQRLYRRVQSGGFASTDDYLAQLVSGRLGEPEMAAAIDLITTNTTSFFRERTHFDELARTVVPDLIASHRPGRARLKLWSAASSEGAEAYSMAMVLAEARRSGQDFDWSVLGTDISATVLDKARSGIYDAAQLAPVEPQLRDRYVMVPADPAARGQVRIVPELRAKVRFAHLNLIDPVYPLDRDIDAIFLRNVLIYFTPENRHKVVRRLHGHLRRGGYLFLGHSEGMAIRTEGLERIRPTIFRKTA